ncbi:8996_t:CDS:2 [Dentiscutata erythropus]|uniref:8996_t:CDS:1 n=1 Tax=Dentiscutata erythropus TaxID=1348616 RepID=A0A9N9N2H4_9GLOM|nr:8996_t:CDS:2 [Dentiscutata erythropus]
MHCHILPLVIECLSNNRKSLHSCIQVSRVWCRAAIPVLWSNPFRCVDKDNIPEIIFIYLGSLEKSEKEKFLSKIPANKKYLFNTPTFDYVKFLKHFNYWMLVSSIKEAARNLDELDKVKLLYTSPDSTTQLFYFNDNPPLEGILKSYVMKLIYDRSKRLNYFTFADYYGIGHFLEEKDYNQFKRIRNGYFLKSIKKLSFWIDDRSFYKVFSWIPDFCPNVKHLKFRLTAISDSDSNTITKALSKFKDLRTFKLKVNHRRLKKMPSIANHIHSLTTIVLRNCDLKNGNFIQEIAQFMGDYCKEIVEWAKSISPQLYDDINDNLEEDKEAAA